MRRASPLLQRQATPPPSLTRGSNFFLTPNMGAMGKKIAKRSKIKSFVNVYNYNRLMPPGMLVIFLWTIPQHVVPMSSACRVLRLVFVWDALDGDDPASGNGLD